MSREVCLKGSMLPERKKNAYTQFIQFAGCVYFRLILELI